MENPLRHLIRMAKKLRPSSKAAPDPIAQRIRARRKERGWSLADLAREAGLKAPSYVLHIEKGEKVPSEEVAGRLARALGEDVESFTAWARLRAGTSTWAQALHSARIAEQAVRAIERDPRHKVVHRAQSVARPPEYDEFASLLDRLDDEPGALKTEKSSTTSAPIRLLEDGQDPDARRPVRGQRRTLMPAVDLDEDVRRHFRDLVAPFAYRLTPASVRRAPNLLPPGFYAILTRSVLPLEAHEAYAVRVKGRTELGFVHWDGERLALLPHTDPRDLVILPARSQDELEKIIAGKIAIVTQPETISIKT